MKKLFSLNLLIALAVVFASCSTNNNVVSNRLISKRKYNKGFHINRKGNMKSASVEKEEESVAFNDVKTTKKENEKPKVTATRSADVSRDVQSVTTTNTSEVVSNESGSKKVRKAHRSTDGAIGDDAISSDTQEMIDEASNENERTSSEQTDRKQTKKKLRALSNRASDPDVMTILLVILALFIAPLAVGIYEGITNRFWITLILWLIGVGVGFFIFGGALAWLCGLIAAIYAILIVLGIV